MHSYAISAVAASVLTLEGPQPSAACEADDTEAEALIRFRSFGILLIEFREACFDSIDSFP